MTAELVIKSTSPSGTKRWPYFVAIAVGAAVGLLALLYSPNGAQPPRGEFPLNAVAASLDLGEVWEDQSISHNVYVLNRSQQPVELLDVSSSCGCTAISPASMTIPARGTAGLKLNLNLVQRAGGRTTTPGTPFELTLRPKVAGVEAAKTLWVVKTRVKAAIALPPKRRLFLRGPIVRGVPDSWQAQSFVLPCAPEVGDVKVTTESDDLAITADVNSSEKAHEVTLTVTPSPDLDSGYFATPVTITSYSSSGDRLATIGAEFQGQVIDEFFAAPDMVYFAAHESDRKGRTVSVVLQSVSQRPFSVSVATCADERVSVRVDDTKSAKLTHTVEVGWTAGSLTADIRPEVEFQLEAGDEHVIRLPIRFLGQ